MLTDWPEGQAATLVRAHATLSKCNCRVCFHPTAEFSSTENGVVYGLRKQQEMRDMCLYHHEQIRCKIKGAGVAAKQDGLNYSMWWVRSAMWNMDTYTDDSGFFAQFPFDTLHTISSGLIRMLRLILLELVDIAPNTRLELSRRFSRIPMVRGAVQRNLYYRAFNTGIQSQSK
jgi:hypothetical protein